VTFDSDVDVASGYYLVTPGLTSTNALLFSAEASPTPNAIFVLFADRTGVRRNADFTLAVFDTPAPVTHALQVRRHTSATLADADADRILADATTVAQAGDGAGDVPCAVALARNGPVGTFTTGSGIINSGADFTAVNGLPGNVKVVNQINFCSTPGIGIIGCAPVPGVSLVVVRFTANQEGILWLHEFGHNKGLGHRTGADFVMNPVIGPNRLQVNTAECTAYRQ
jgi:hypothetical protein